MRTLRIGSALYPLEGHYQYRGDDHADGAHQVGEDVLEGAFDVHAVLGGAVEDVGDEKVDQQAAYADQEHR